MNEVREVSTSDIKNSEKVHMGDEEETGLTQGDNVRADDPGFFRRSYRGERSPPRRALGAAGEGEDREDSPGQGADSPPLGNLPPREQSADERKGGEQEKKVGRAGQWRQTAAALRAPWRRPRREEPSRLCWLVSTTTHALCILTGGDHPLTHQAASPQESEPRMQRGGTRQRDRHDRPSGRPRGPAKREGKEAARARVPLPLALARAAARAFDPMEGN